MNSHCTFILLFTLSLHSPPAKTEERIVESRIVSAALFKNGLAVITREVALAGPGTHVLEQVPAAVHSTLWLEGPEDLHARSTLREVVVADSAPNFSNLQQQLAGRDVTLHLKGEPVRTIMGKVSASPPPSPHKWNREYDRPLSHYEIGSFQRQQTPGNSFLALQTPDGLDLVETAAIQRIQLHSPEPLTSTETQPVMLLTTSKPEPTPLRMSYLTKGLSWAPSYRVTLRNDKTLTVDQKAVIKNELENLDGAELHLVSGFPNMPTRNVLTPFSPEQSWAAFFQQLTRKPEAGILDTQQVYVVNMPQPGMGEQDFGALSRGEGPDLYYHPAGKLSLNAGDSLLLPIASAKADYSPIVEWTIPDLRDEYGRNISENDRRNKPEKYQDELWDAIQFRNPFDFPMTTGPVVIHSGKTFLGQSTSYWVNSGEMTTLYVTKTLSIRARHVEQEIPESREDVRILGNMYYRVTLEGKLLMNNHRNEEVSLVVRKRFSGNLVEADGEPTTRLLEEGAWSRNPRNELTWRTKLAPGEEKTFTYRYSILLLR